MDARNLKIACCGPSGSGKTTLCKGLSKELGARFIPSSVGLIFTDEQKAELAKFGYQSKGHQNVINLSNTIPEFGKLFQQYALKARAKLLSGGADQLIVDRSPIDNLTYASLQCLHNMTEEEYEEFYNQCLLAYQELTHVIYVRSVCPEIEINDSRVGNKYYQRMTDNIFHASLLSLSQDAGYNGPKIMMVNTWDKDPMDRVKRVLRFIQE